MAPNRPARPVSTSHLSTAASPASPDIGGSVGELHEVYDQLEARASASRDFQLAGIPLVLQTMRNTGAQSEPGPLPQADRSTAPEGTWTWRGRPLGVA
jgi:hypothetical protein